MGNSLNKCSHDASPCEENVSIGNTLEHLQSLPNRDLLTPLRGNNDSENMRDADGNTPLHLSVKNESPEMFNALLNLKRTQIDVINSHNGLTALTMAVMHDREYYTLKLIEKGADVNIVHKDGSTPLHYAVKFSSEKFCKLLINSGAKVNAQNLLGETPLHVACQYGNTEKVCMLLYYGADPSLPSKNGNIPLLINRVNTFQMHLQEALHYYIFDDNEVTMQLKILVRAMVLNWPFFPKLMEKTSKITFDEADLHYLNESLPDIAPRNFKLFLEKFDYSVRDMFYNCCTLSYYLTAIESMRRTTPESVDFLYVLLESRLVHDAVQSCCKSFSVVASLVKIFRKNKMQLKALTKLVCCLLSYGLNLTSTDLNAVYVVYGRCELFNIMLHMDIEPVGKEPPCCIRCDYEVVQESIMARFIYDINLNIYKFLERPQWLLSMDLEVLLDYFAIPKLRNFFLMDCFQGHKVGNIVAKLPTVPCLIELSRNAAREFIIKRYRIQNSRQFYTVIKCLPFSDVYKKILTYEKKLYHF